MVKAYVLISFEVNRPSKKSRIRIRTRAFSAKFSLEVSLRFVLVIDAKSKQVKLVSKKLGDTSASFTAGKHQHVRPLMVSRNLIERSSAERSLPVVPHSFVAPHVSVI